MVWYGMGWHGVECRGGVKKTLYYRKAFQNAVNQLFGGGSAEVYARRLAPDMLGERSSVSQHETKRTCSSEFPLSTPFVSSFLLSAAGITVDSKASPALPSPMFPPATAAAAAAAAAAAPAVARTSPVAERATGTVLKTTDRRE